MNNHPSPIRFSLIMATVGRTTEVARFLHSLSIQDYGCFELIVVDQNPDDRLAAVLEPYRERFAIQHLRCRLGLSRARNAGLRQAGGDVIAFPDDDCWYPPDTLQNVADFLLRSEWDGLSGRVVDENGTPSVVRWDRNAGVLNVRNVWRRACSISMFLRRRVIDAVGQFDENLGAGARWGSGEETDYLLRAIACRFRIFFDPRITVGHPNPTPRYDSAAIKRARSYGLGHGRLLAKHRIPLRQKVSICFRPLGGGLLALARLNPAKAQFHFAVFKGRLVGWTTE